MKKAFALFLIVCASYVHANTNEVTKLTSENFEKIMSSAKPVIITVHADWCGRCESFAPIFHEARQNQGAIYEFVLLDPAKEEALVQKLSIKEYPTCIFVKDGKEVGRTPGAAHKAEFEAHLNKHFKE